jgi:hypothetical protein
LYFTRHFGTVIREANRNVSTTTRQALSDLGTVAVVIAFVWMLLL